ncbi:MAG: hypothetical protein B9S38_02495 [Verrucomicrobiia bacterium Tous-C4TDCM]|nr:MAG: hypothetical protein B9S38_02495 [Verrucomicrobiae bacterium Tous-C4TDCM]
MGSPSIPAQPAAPDYAAANREAITTDISTLPVRRQIDTAARLGQRVTYLDPQTGQEKTVDFTGSGDSAYAQQMADLAASTNATTQRQQLQLRQELGEANARQTAAEIRAADPEGYQARQDLTNRVRQEMAMGPASVAASGNIASAENRMWNIANSAPGADGRLGGLIDRAGNADGRLGNIYDEATRLPGAASDSSTNALNAGLQRAMQEFELGGKLGADEKRALLNDVRAGQAARGNYLGDGAAVAEQMEVGQAEDARKAQRLSSLLAIQGAAFGQNSQLRDETARNATNRVNTMAAVQGQDFGQRSTQIGQQAGLIGQDFGQNQQAYTTGLNAAQAAFSGTQAMANDQRAARQEGFGYDQQRLANASSVALGAPITNQFGSLGGAQQGAVGFTPTNFQPGQTTNPNAGALGANFAQGNFGTQANMWGQRANIAAQGNPWMSLLGNAAGAATGAATAALI